MFTKSARAAAVAAIAAAALSMAAAAQAAPVYQISSPVFWSSTGAYADLVLRYDPRASATLTVNQFYAVDLFGQNVSTQLESCGAPVKTGDSVTAHALSPGQICWVRVYRTNDAIVGRAALTVSGGAATTNQFVRASVETRDANNNVLTHVELR
jgi:hypothetical protein